MSNPPTLKESLLAFILTMSILWPLLYSGWILHF